MLFNASRAERILARDGIDALVATSPENVLYSSDYQCATHWINKGFQVYSLFTPGHHPRASLIAPGLELEALVDDDVWVDDVYVFSPFQRGSGGDRPMDPVGQAVEALSARAHPAPSALDGLVAAIEARGLSKGRIAVDELGITPPLFAELQSRLPDAEISLGNPVWWEVRMVKTPEEVRRLREASRITEDAIVGAFELVRSGATESEITREYRRRVVEQDGAPTFCILGSGTRSGYPHSLGSDKVIEQGDVVRYDSGCTYRYYQSDTARAVVVGSPTAEQQSIWDALCEGVESAIALVAPGADVRDLYTAAMEPGRTAALADFDRFHCGHGMGINVYDPPIVTMADPSQSAFLMPSVEDGLEPGMVLNLEVGYYMQGVEGYLCEDTLLVTETGHERLTRNSKSLALDDFLARPTA